jgi:FkbM family methyltransferase
MNMAVRRFFQGTPILSDLYGAARSAYQRRRLLKAATRYFSNPHQYRMALDTEDGKIVELYSKDGLIITVRQNYMDAAILGEIFFNNCYATGLDHLPARPIVVDVGGYIGDSALWAVKRLNASKVVVCEPSQRNWALLEKNIANNHYEDRIEAVNKAVTDGEDVMMNIDAPDRRQARVSAYGSGALEQKRVPGIALANLVENHGLKAIDLLKIDCEGGEYAILSTTPTHVLSTIRNIVFECHEIDGFEAKLEAVKQRLFKEGFSLKVRGSLVYASRA